MKSALIKRWKAFCSRTELFAIIAYLRLELLKAAYITFFQILISRAMRSISRRKEPPLCLLHHLPPFQSAFTHLPCGSWAPPAKRIKHEAAACNFQPSAHQSHPPALGLGNRQHTLCPSMPLCGRAEKPTCNLQLRSAAQKNIPSTDRILPYI